MTEEEKKKQRWLTIEHNRKKRESYEVKKFSGWLHFAWVGIVTIALVAILAELGGIGGGVWESIAVTTFVSFILSLMLLGFASSVEGTWEISVAAKEEIEREHKESESNGDNSDVIFPSGGENSKERTLNGFQYKEGYIYTDSFTSYWLYKLARFVAIPLTIIAIPVIILATVGVIVLLFMWLGSISIAPTTIIIILLIWILVKLHDKNES